MTTTTPGETGTISKAIAAYREASVRLASAQERYLVAEREENEARQERNAAFDAREKAQADLLRIL